MDTGLRFLRRRLWPRSRMRKSRPDPPEWVGTSGFASAAKAGAGQIGISCAQIRALSAHARVKFRRIELRPARPAFSTPCEEPLERPSPDTPKRNERSLGRARPARARARAAARDASHGGACPPRSDLAAAATHLTLLPEDRHCLLQPLPLRRPASRHSFGDHRPVLVVVCPTPVFREEVVLPWGGCAPTCVPSSGADMARCYNVCNAVSCATPIDGPPVMEL